MTRLDHVSQSGLMVNRVLAAVARPAMRLWLNLSEGIARGLPRPDQAESWVHSPGPDPDRLLIMGSGVSVGFAVRSHELALAGHIARQLATETGRGNRVDIFADAHLTAREAIGAIDSLHLDRFDAAVLTLGSPESQRLNSTTSWDHELGELLDAVIDAGGRDMCVFVLAVPPVSLVGRLPSFLEGLVDDRVQAFNEVSRRICATRPAVMFIPFAPGSRALPVDGSSATYAQWAALVVTPIAAQFTSRQIAVTRSAALIESTRQHSVERSGVLGSGHSTEIDRLVVTARDLFGTQAAAVTVLDDSRQWIKSASGVSAEDTPRASAFCDVTVSGGALLVVTDASRDPRFVDNPWVTGEARIRFYAGYPIETADGERIGTLCVMATEPREFSETDATLLRELALRVQRTLWEAS